MEHSKWEDFSFTPRTPEPQRFHSRCVELCRVPLPLGHVRHCAGEEQECVAGNEEEQGLGVCVTDPLALHDDGGVSCTPQTRCQRSSQQSAPFEGRNLRGALHSNFCPAFGLPSSPGSCLPSSTDAPVVRRARSPSCLSANRSVAPARHSVGWPGGEVNGPSEACHPALLGSMKDRGAPSACGATRPTVLLHPTLSIAGLEATVGGHRDAVNAFGRHAWEGSGQATSVPRLTRLSISSCGQSPAVPVNWSIGRPTALRPPDAEGERNDDWVGCNVEVEVPPVEGTTRTWRCSTEGRMTALPGRLLGEEEEEAALMAVPPEHGASSALSKESDLPYNTSPRPLHAVPPMSRSPSHFASWKYEEHAVLLSDAPAESQKEMYEDHVHEPEALVGLIGCADSDLSSSFVGLGDAPRKSYAKSNCSTPPASKDRDAGRRAVATDYPLSNAPYASGTTSDPKLPVDGIATTLGNASCETHEAIGEWGHDGVNEGHSLRGTCITAAPAHPLPFRELSTSIQKVASRGEQWVSTQPDTTSRRVAANTVVAQLAHLSLQASPTQKRLAFEDDDDDEGSDMRSSGGGAPKPVLLAGPSTRDASNTGSLEARTKYGYRGGERRSCHPNEIGRRSVSNGVSRRSLTVAGGGERTRTTNRGCPSGLQLLRSRKRCLAEMRAGDIISGASHSVQPCASGGGVCLFGHQGLRNASAAQLPVRKLDAEDEDWKRHKKEDPEARQLGQGPFSDGSDAGDDLIPTPAQMNTSGIRHPSSFHLDPSSRDLRQHTYKRLDFYTSHPASWSELSDLSYITPASQSTSTLMWSAPSNFSLAGHGGGGNAVTCSTEPAAQVLSPLPINSASLSSTQKA